MILKNSYDIINKMKDNLTKYLNTWDFEDLLNSINIEDLLISLNNFYIENSIDKIIDKKNFKSICDLVLRENYILYKGKYYMRKKGILQGTIASYRTANTYLHTYENKRNIRENFVIFRYIDDLFAFTIKYS